MIDYKKKYIKYNLNIYMQNKLLGILLVIVMKKTMVLYYVYTTIFVDKENEQSNPNYAYR